MVSIDTVGGLMQNENKRIETKQEVKTYLAKLKYAINNGAKIFFQANRKVDDDRDEKHTNSYTVATLFPDEDPVDALKNELLSLSVEEYLCTVKDLQFPNRSEMRVFGRKYTSFEDVYIKIRVELIAETSYGSHMTFVMSFHFAEFPFGEDDFPFKKN